jgi:3-dehydrosphinganine reductase
MGWNPTLFDRFGVLFLMTTKLKDFQGKVVLITGGSSGMGLATARLLAGQGANVWLLARRPDHLAEALKLVEAAASDHDQRFGTIVADVTDQKQVQNAIARVIETAGLPDLVINSAGAAHPGYLQELGMDVFRAMMDLNYFGTINVIHALLPGMISRRSGYIVNIASEAAFLGVFGYSAYAPSKYAVRGYSDVLRVEMKPFGIAVSIVFPPDTDTPGFAHENLTKPVETKELGGSLISPDVIARAILKGVKRGRYIILPGLESNVLYWARHLLGNAIYPFMDMLTAQAQRKKEKLQSQNEHSVRVHEA